MLLIPVAFDSCINRTGAISKENVSTLSVRADLRLAPGIDGMLIFHPASVTHAHTRTFTYTYAFAGELATFRRRIKCACRLAPFAHYC